MANFRIKVDLLKLKGAFVTNIQGRSATKKCLCIPIDESGVFLGEKGCYLNLTAIEMQNPKYEETHCLKVSHDRAVYERMTDEERKSQPIVGGLKQLAKSAQAVQMDATDAEDLPF